MSFVTNEPWATHADLAAVGVEWAAPITNAIVDMGCAIASDMLYLLTGSTWPGVGSDKVRPQARWRQWDQPRWWANVDGQPGARYGYCSCNRGRDTGCTRLPEIKLPHRIIVADSIVVKVDGAVLNPANYRLDDSRYLVRVDGNGWPCCQDLTKADTEPHTFSIAMDWGSLPDQGGVIAAASLGYELALAFSGNPTGKCRLPKRVTHITRGSTSIAVLDPLTLFKDGLTGITEVDLWLVSKLLGTGRRGASVTRPGQTRSVRRTG